MSPRHPAYGSGSGKIHGAGKIQQRGFAASATSHQGHKFAGVELQRNVLQRHHRHSFCDVLLAHALQSKNTHTSSVVASCFARQPGYLCNSWVGGVGGATGATGAGSAAVPPSSNTNSIGGFSIFSSVGPTAGGRRPAPAMKAMYCFPSTIYVIGGAAPTRLVRISRSLSPLSALYANSRPSPIT